MLKFSLVFLSIFIGIRGFSCPTGSFQSPNEDLCIYAISDVDFYSDAVQQCNRLGGNVVKIKNIFENAFLLGLIGSVFPAGQAPYIGVVKLSNGTWVYSDGTPLIYANWAPGEPSAAQGLTSAVMDPQSGRWKAADPTALRPFFCGVDGDLFQCPNNWNYFEATDSCYYLQNFTAADEANFTLYLWPDAEKLCVNAGAHLASIHSKEENDFVSNLIQTNVFLNDDFCPPQKDPCYWIWTYLGFRGLGKPSEQWTDGTPFDWSQWGEPMDKAMTLTITNDYSCRVAGWGANDDRWPTPIPRFVCKKPNATKLRNEMNNVRVTK